MPERLHYLINFPHPTLFIFATGEDLLLNCNLRKKKINAVGCKFCLNAWEGFPSFPSFSLILKKKPSWENPTNKFCVRKKQLRILSFLFIAVLAMCGLIPSQNLRLPNLHSIPNCGAITLVSERGQVVWDAHDRGHNARLDQRWSPSCSGTEGPPTLSPFSPEFALRTAPHCSLGAHLVPARAVQRLCLHWKKPLVLGLMGTNENNKLLWHPAPLLLERAGRWKRLR